MDKGRGHPCVGSAVPQRDGHLCAEAQEELVWKGDGAERRAILKRQMDEETNRFIAAVL